MTNAFSAQPAVSPGALLTIYGTNFLPGAVFKIDGMPIPLLYVGAAQINGQVPFETALGSSTLVVKTGVESAPVNVQVAATAPAILTSPDGGRESRRIAGMGA